MGEQVAREWFERAGLDVEVDSFGVSAEEYGNPIDSRAARTLRAHDYPVGDHRAQQITAADIEAADLVLGFEPIHVSRMLRMAPDAGNIRLVTDFDPDATPGSGIDDPWYGQAAGFEDTLASIEAAMPGIVEAVEQLGDDAP